MTLIDHSVELETTECIRLQVFIPPLVVNGKRMDLRNPEGGANINMPPIAFLAQDPDTGDFVNARFYPMSMHWELVKVEEKDQLKE